VPGALKNAIDWASRPYGDSAWQGKPVAVMSASVGILAARARSTICASPSCSSPEVLIANAAQRFNERGELNDEVTREQIRKLLAELAAWTRKLKG